MPKELCTFCTSVTSDPTNQKKSSNLTTLNFLFRIKLYIKWYYRTTNRYICLTIWKITQLRVRMNVSDWVQFVFDSKWEMLKPALNKNMKQCWEVLLFFLESERGFKKVNWILPFENFQTVMSTVTGSTMMDTIFSDFLILYQIFFSPQVKRSVIISNKHGIYELPSDVTHRVLSN